MLTVLRRDGTLVELVSSEQTNHVGIEGPQLVGRNIRSMLSPEACRNVKNNLENVFASGKGSSSHHDITLDGRTRNYENRIMPSTANTPSASAATSPRPKSPSTSWRWSSMR